MWRRDFSPGDLTAGRAQQAPVPIFEQRVPFGQRVAVVVREVVSRAGKRVHGSNVRPHPDGTRRDATGKFS